MSWTLRQQAPSNMQTTDNNNGRQRMLRVTKQVRDRDLLPLCGCFQACWLEVDGYIGWVAYLESMYIMWQAVQNQCMHNTMH